MIRGVTACVGVLLVVGALVVGWVPALISGLGVAVTMFGLFLDDGAV